MALLAPTARADEGVAPEHSATVTKVSQIRLLSSQTPTASYSFHLEGDVGWANPAGGTLVLTDGSGAEELEMDWRGQPIEAGQRISLDGNGTITPTSAGFKIGARGPVVNNDGVHGMVEKNGAVFLKAGRTPIRVEWFNGVEKYGLQVEYKGPGLARQKIPDAALSREQVDVETGARHLVQGLAYRCSAAPSEVLPDFNSSNALAAGFVTNFDLSVMARPEHVGLAFTGFLEIPKDGLYTFYTTSDDGSRLFVGEPSLRLKVIGRATWPKAQPLAVGQALRPEEESQWVQVEGRVTFACEEPDGLHLELSGRTGRMRLEVPPGSGLTSASLLNRHVRATGYGQGASTFDGQRVLSALLVPNAREIEVMEPPLVPAEIKETKTTGLPLLTSAAEIHRLKREEAQRGYPVKIRGVITSVLPEHQAFTVQDATRGIYVVDFSESRTDSPRIGEFVEVEGVTDPSLFAPVVNAGQVQTLGAGELPEPIHPTRDQLMNGSLDAQYVEIQGILTSVQDDGVTLLTSDGRIKTELRVAGLKTRDLERYEDALIRVRGCLFANWDYVTHRVKVGEIRIYGASLAVEQAAPADLFAIPRKPASDLFLFDPQARDFQRVKVSGLIVNVKESEFFMMDGSNGVRFIAKHPASLQVGDMVDVVGFPEWSSASPVLREAVVRKTGQAPLPQPRELNADDLTRADLDATRVRVQALLVNQRSTPTGQALEMHAGLRSFLALLPASDKDTRAIPAGSFLDLTGTCVMQGVSQDVASFGLLLNSPSDVAVLARPPWWTLERLLFILGALACVLATTVLWITQLRRKVEQRSAELEMQIRERQRVQQQHAMEQERARIAQDLHDELGSGLTEISMLGARALSASGPIEKRGHYLEQMSNQARQMVTALDEIVWAMNPTHDSLGSMVSYFSLYAERFLGLANIAWRLEGPFTPDDHAVDSRHRHQLFLAFKEALNNVVRHADATEVRLNIQMEQGRVRLTIADNGRGWVEAGQTDEMDGLANMRGRLEKLGGRFEVNSKTGQGTIVRFDLPLP
ncbi:MAG TPA: ATP-binding protein [Verrucomicrobiae bacterium]|jgi:signal transduction histidine kinase|nr:ATP-binding protein [Verrucomicrobiae bacterium]